MDQIRYASSNSPWSNAAYAEPRADFGGPAKVLAVTHAIAIAISAGTQTPSAFLVVIILV